MFYTLGNPEVYERLLAKEKVEKAVGGIVFRYIELARWYVRKYKKLWIPYALPDLKEEDIIWEPDRMLWGHIKKPTRVYRVEDVCSPLVLKGGEMSLDDAWYLRQAIKEQYGR